MNNVKDMWRLEYYQCKWRNDFQNDVWTGVSNEKNFRKLVQVDLVRHWHEENVNLESRMINESTLSNSSSVVVKIMNTMKTS